ncbi:MAG: VCBS repeat-containing protein [Cytophagales bacterium]|nr:VCBS repeat-containing protein [Cytophagales bacterium]
MFRVFIFAFICAVFSKCAADQKGKTLFLRKNSLSTMINFRNELIYSEDVNAYTFKNFYNGGGVGLGDFNSDGLLDIFLAGNQVSNRLYINQGNFKFKDFTDEAGLSSIGSWTTGVSIVDINGDNLPDIYLCKSGPPNTPGRKNQLWINKGGLRFEESAEIFGLDHLGLSTHAAFFDFDLDGDLDCYLLNNSIRSIGAYDLRPNQRLVRDSLGGNKLLRNDKGKFIDVTAEVGIFSSAIGFGLGVTICDINMDGWPDIYVSNDFFERDYLYINQDGIGFIESLEDYIQEHSMGSMGADVADVNNDLLPDIFVTEMLPRSDARLKTKAQFENWEKLTSAHKNGYGKQFGRNVLQKNNGNGTFSEVGRYAEVDATDWSWGALLFDMDNDGLKDIFVANGIYKDLLDQDYVNFMANPDRIRKMILSKGKVIKQLMDSIPSAPIANFAFQNLGDFQFSDNSLAWGFNEETYSNGSAYGDLDNDGDLDLVINNVNMTASVFENTANTVTGNNSFSIDLKMVGKNSSAIGAKVFVKTNSIWQYQENNPFRGFMSTVDSRLHFGVGKLELIDTVIIVWPNSSTSLLTNLKVNVLHEVSFEKATLDSYDWKRNFTRKDFTYFGKPQPNSINFTHVESEFNDFDQHRLKFIMSSNEGPCLCKGDINGDGKDDFYIGGAKGKSGSLFVTQGNSYTQVNQNQLEQDRESEDTGCVFFDANGDGMLDLYVSSGSLEYSTSSVALADRLYFNFNKFWKKSEQLLPSKLTFESTKAVTAADFDLDGDMDLFVGVRLNLLSYGTPCSGYLLKNDGHGNFESVSETIGPGLTELGMITDARWSDLNNDGLPDLIVVGEWMPIKCFININGQLLDRTKELGLQNSNGWYQSVEIVDINSDGLQDIVVGNHGLNSQFKASFLSPLTLYVSDFDRNGFTDPILTRRVEGKELPMVLRNELLAQIPGLRKKYVRFKDYANQTVQDLFEKSQLDQALRLTATELKSAVWINTGSGFEQFPLPYEAQLFPIYAILPIDADSDGNLDLLVGGNQSKAKPQMGIYSAGYGAFLKGRGNGNFDFVPPRISGIEIKGDIRSIKCLNNSSDPLILIARSNDSLVFLSKLKP